MINHKSILITFCSVFLATFGLWQIGSSVFAEQSRGTPDSGATSTIKTIYDSLTTLTHGSDSPGSWGDLGAMWNRIRSAGEWVPSDSATETDVATGKTFHNTSRTQKTGTASLAPDYSTQSLATKDDYYGTYKGEETTWTEVTGSPFSGYGDLNIATGKVKKDSLTGLWWSASSTTLPSNSFTLSEDGARPTGGNAIAFCNALNTASYGGHADWYLPTQKELMQAYIDGIYSQDADFATISYFWSSTEYSEDPGGAWLVHLPYGSTVVDDKSFEGFYAVRCVRRD